MRGNADVEERLDINKQYLTKVLIYLVVASCEVPSANYEQPALCCAVLCCAGRLRLCNSAVSAGYTFLGADHAVHSGNGCNWHSAFDAGLAVLRHEPRLPRVRFSRHIA